MPNSTTFLTPAGARKATIHLRGWAQGRGYLRTLIALEWVQDRMTGSRKDGVTPNWTHPVAVASFLRTLVDLVPNGDLLVTTSLLHDIVEDTDTTVADVELAFGAEVADTVDRLSKPAGAHGDAMMDAYAARIAEHPVSILAKGGDRLHNFHSMPGVFSAAKQTEYVAECERWILPLLKQGARRYPAYEAAMVNVRSALAMQVAALKAVAVAPVTPTVGQLADAWDSDSAIRRRGRQ